MNLFLKLYKDERGFVLTIELLLIVSIVVIGLVAGLVALREAIVTELNEVSQAISEMTQKIVPGGSISGVDTSDFAGESTQQSNNCVEVYSSLR